MYSVEYGTFSRKAALTAGSLVSSAVAAAFPCGSRRVGSGCRHSRVYCIWGLCTVPKLGQTDL